MDSISISFHVRPIPFISFLTVFFNSWVESTCMVSTNKCPPHHYASKTKSINCQRLILLLLYPVCALSMDTDLNIFLYISSTLKFQAVQKRRTFMDLNGRCRAQPGNSGWCPCWPSISFASGGHTIRQICQFSRFNSWPQPISQPTKQIAWLCLTPDKMRSQILNSHELLVGNPVVDCFSPGLPSTATSKSS